MAKGTFSITTTSKLLVAANAARGKLHISNPSATIHLWLAFGETAVKVYGRMVPFGTSVTIDDPQLVGLQVNGVTAAGTVAGGYQEV